MMPVENNSNPANRVPRQADRRAYHHRLQLRWKLMLRGILHLWVNSRELPDALGQTGAQPGKPVCYVMDDYALSSLLILDKCCEKLALPRPLHPIAGLEQSEDRSYAVLKRMQGIFVRRPSTRRSSEVLKRLVDACYADPKLDIQLVPVTVFVGRTPDKSTGLAKILFAPNWEVAGRFRRFFSTLINGRNTLVQFSRPISMQELAAEGIGASRSLRKVSRILRTHFRRVRVAAIGPDLSHRRMVIDRVIKSPAVKRAIRAKSQRTNMPLEKAERLARKYALEIAADYSYSFVRIAFIAIDWFTRKIYDGLTVRNFERFKSSALDYTIVYVPCHRSHADYLLVSYLLYQNGIVPPHVAAGVNLNLPVLGSWIRGGGAFYVRRTFRSQKLYSAVFTEYVSTILAQGVSIEYFIEGTRSRTGRLIPPKAGMLAMTVRGYLSAPVRPIMFQPVYIGYEQLLEGNSYTKELSGTDKRSEKLTDLLKVFKVLRHRYGEATLSFGQPIFLDDLLEEHDPDWRKTASGTDGKPPWLNPLIDILGNRILWHINATADVNPVNLLSTVLLATPKHALGEKELLEQFDLYRHLLTRGPLGDSISFTQMDGKAIVEYGFTLKLLQRTIHPLGDILAFEPHRAVSMTYFRNNVAHLFALPSLIACCFLNQRVIRPGQLNRIAHSVFPFLKAELFLPWSEDELDDALRQNLDLLADSGLLTVPDSGGEIQRAEGGTADAGQLNLLARCLLQTLERYFITITVLTKNGSGTLNRAQLEKLCMLTAQRISQLHEFEAPEFYDRRLFRQFISELRRLGYLTNSPDEKLEFGERLNRISRDARFILSKEIRHGISRIAPQVLDAEI
jgi:glycerol-3-phosphate O-acyltransferase